LPHFCQPTFKDIKAKNAAFAATARENAGKPRIRNTPSSATEETTHDAKQPAKRGRTNVRPARRDRLAAANKSALGGSLRNNKLALGLIVFVVVGGGEYQLFTPSSVVVASTLRPGDRQMRGKQRNEKER